MKDLAPEAKKVKKCPSCGEIWDGIECDSCGFEIGCFDPNWD